MSHSSLSFIFIASNCFSLHLICGKCFSVFHMCLLVCLKMTPLLGEFPTGGGGSLEPEVSAQFESCYIPLSLSRNLEWNVFNYRGGNKIDLNVSVKYIGLPRFAVSGSPSLITVQQCPEYLNKVLITYISESSVSVTPLITLSVSPSCFLHLLSSPLSSPVVLKSNLHYH